VPFLLSLLLLLPFPPYSLPLLIFSQLLCLHLGDSDLSSFDLSDAPFSVGHRDIRCGPLEVSVYYPIVKTRSGGRN